MKSIASLLLVAISLLGACNNESKSGNAATGTNTKKDPMDQQSSDVPRAQKDQADFMATCMIDAANWAGTDEAKRTTFCTCAWEKSRGRYAGEIIAAESKLRQDPTLKECYEKVQR